MSLGVARRTGRVPDLRSIAAELRPAPLAVGALTAAVFGLHLSQLHQSLFGDEVFAYHEVVGHSLSGTLHTVGTGVESSPPLFFVLAWFSVKLGDPTVWIRLPSLILGAATIPALYLLGRDTINRAAGVVGAAAFALSPFSLYYGVEARPYATMAFFTVLSTYALVRAVRSRERRWWAAYAVFAAAAAYSHYTALFVLLTQGVWSLWACRDRWRQPVFANAAAALLYVPWLHYLHASRLLGAYALEPRTASNVIKDVVRFVVGYPYAPIHAIPTHLGLAAIAACAAAGGLVLARRYLGDRAQAAHDVSDGGLLLIVALALASPIGVLLYSVLSTDIWAARSLYASAPAAALVLGALLVALPRWPRAIAVPVVLGVLVFGTIRGISPSWRRPQYRTVAEYLDRVAKPRDPVLMFTYRIVLDRAIPAQMKRPHTIVTAVPKRWPRRPRGTPAFVIVDDGVLPLLRPALHPRGYALVARRDYRGLVDFTLFTYRAL